MYTKLKFNLARNSLRYLIQTYQIEKLHLPYYLCDEVRHAVVKEGCRPIFYHIDDSFKPQTTFDKEDYILYPNYFGICDKNINILEKLYPKLIVDNAHAFYTKPQGFACFNAEHKFNPETQASYLWIRGNHYTLRACPQNRIDKFIDLHQKYSQANCLDIDIHSIKSPFCYPFLAKDNKSADNLAEKLTSEGLIIYRYWNSLPKSYNEYKFYRRLVPIPIITNSSNANSIQQDS